MILQKKNYIIIDFDQYLSALLESGEKAEKIVQFLTETENRLAGILDDEWADFINSI